MIRRKCRIPECQDEIGTMQLHHYRCGQVMANAHVTIHIWVDGSDVGPRCADVNNSRIDATS